MPHKALITGATGLLGREVLSQFSHAGWSVLGTGYSRATDQIIKLDLTDASAIAAALDQHKPDAVVHCAANRTPDSVDSDPAAARALNIDATAALVHAAASRGTFTLYISTDYVFPGRPGEAPYSSHAQTGPTNLYGQTKLDGEGVVLDSTRDNGLGAVLRVPVLYGPVDEGKGNKESAVNSLLDAVHKAQKENVVMDDWGIRYPTCTTDVGRVCKDVCERFVGRQSTERLGMERTLQFSAEERFTKYEICAVLAEIMGLPVGGLVANKEGNEPGGVQRPFDCHLSNEALRGIGVDAGARDFRGWWRWEVKAFRR